MAVLKQIEVNIEDRVLAVIAEEDGQIVGTIRSWYLDKPYRTICEVFVKEEYRRKGIARQLLTYVMAQAKGIPHNLTVNKTNTAAIELYKQLGFFIYNENEKMWYMLALNN